jgi:hypothetical protein
MLAQDKAFLIIGIDAKTWLHAKYRSLILTVVGQILSPT